jgi:pyruvate/2-oxoglutarate dehydrogenase complex dihydrolipoamide dehydrogenase (E3) component
VAIGHKPNTDVFKGWIDLDEQGYIKYGEPGTSRTNREGVFVSGDAADKTYRQAVTAAGTGCIAGVGRGAIPRGQRHSLIALKCKQKAPRRDASGGFFNATK